ncbi:MAG: hypothetical protein ACOY40_11170 [Bacillota bacterium]
MTESLGWIGFGLLISTLIPFIRRRLRPGRAGAAFFSRHHHSLALACLAVLTLHGLWALTGRKGWGWGWGALTHLKGDALSGVFAWLAILTVVILATAFSRKKPFPRTHCPVVAILVLLVLIHVS